jgi:hypothetical protein
MVSEQLEGKRQGVDGRITKLWREEGSFNASL